MRALLVLLTLAGLCGVAAAAEISSEYTDLATEKDCVTYGQAEEGEGDWAAMACNGYRGYPVMLSYGDARESILYGFPPENNFVWESFTGFNSSGPKIEWRIEKDRDKAVPFATIHRWFVSAGDEGTKQVEVLVIERVAQPEDKQGCAVGYVVATGNPKANEAARKIADERAKTFSCGVDEPIRVDGAVPVPGFSRDQS